MNALVMYDHQTESLWSHFTGDAVEGSFKGTKLEIIPALQTDWGTWLKLHPDTLALDKGGGGSYDPYVSYYRSGSAGIIGETVQDDRLPTKTFVLGVSLGTRNRAYNLLDLDETPVINDSLDGMPIVIFFDGFSATAAVFERELDGKVLTFSLLEQGEGESPKMVDQETGTTWSALSGEGLEGSKAGNFLRQLPANYAFWFAWKDYHPDTEVYGQ